MVQLVWATMAATLAAIAHRGILLGAAALAAGFWLTIVFPEWHWFIIAGSTSIGLVASVLPWANEQPLTD